MEGRVHIEPRQPPPRAGPDRARHAALSKPRWPAPAGWATGLARALSRSGLGLLDREQGRTKSARHTSMRRSSSPASSATAARKGSRSEASGSCKRERGDVEEAAKSLESALAIAREVGDRQLQGVIHANLAQLHTEQGRIEEARAASNSRSRSIARRQSPPRSHRTRQPRTALPPAGQDRRGASMLRGRDRHRTPGRQSRHQSFLLMSLGILRHSGGRLQEATPTTKQRWRSRASLATPRRGHRARAALGQLHLEQDKARRGARVLRPCAVACARSRLPASRGRRRSAAWGVCCCDRHGGTKPSEVRAGEAILREVADREELSKLLCVRGTIEAAVGERDLAGAALAEAEAIAKAMGSGSSPSLAARSTALRGLTRDRSAGDTLARGQAQG